MKIHKFNISTKKGEIQTVRFLIQQCHPFPSIGGQGGSFKWENCGGLLAAYQSPASGIGRDFSCCLLAGGLAVPPTDWNRTHLAGYGGNGGTITLRGKDIGELSVKISLADYFPRINVRGFDKPSDCEREFIRAQIVPELEEFIRSNLDDLKAEAVGKIKAEFAKQLADTRQTLDAMEKQIEQASY